MKLYKTLSIKKEISITHSEKGVKYKRPRKRVEWVDKDVLAENPRSIIAGSLTRGHLEQQIERIAEYLAALTVGDKEAMARLLDTDYDYSESVRGYKFED
jgi:hypothetical protein